MSKAKSLAESEKIYQRIVEYILSDEDPENASKAAKRFDLSPDAYAGRLKVLDNDGRLSEAQIRKKHSRYKQAKSHVVSTQKIIDFLKPPEAPNPTGITRQDAETLGFKSKKAYIIRLHDLINKEKLSKKDVQKHYPDFGQKAVTIDDEAVADLVLKNDQPRGLKEDADKMGHAKRCFRRSICRCVEKGILALSDIKSRYPHVDWSDIDPEMALHNARKKKEVVRGLNERELELVLAEGFPNDEIAALFGVASKAERIKLDKHIAGHRIQPRQRPTREEFTVVVCEQASIWKASRRMNLKASALLRRVGRYADTDISKLKVLPVRFHGREDILKTLPHDTAPAVLVASKELIGEFKASAQGKPTILDVVERLKISREAAEAHLQKLWDLGFLKRDSFKQGLDAFEKDPLIRQVA